MTLANCRIDLSRRNEIKSYWTRQVHETWAMIIPLHQGIVANISSQDFENVLKIWQRQE
jgi:hypothetical protein